MFHRSFGVFALAGFAVYALGCVSPGLEDEELEAGLLAQALGSSPNLIANASFEDANPSLPSQPLAWRPGNWGTNVSRFSVASEGSAGTRSARVDVTSFSSGDAKWTSDPVAVTAGTAYVYRDTYKSDVTTKLIAAMQLSDGTTAFQTLANVAPSSTWATVNAAITPVANTVRLNIFHLIAAVGYLQIDDVIFSLPDAPVVANGVTNGTLEQASDLNPALPAGWRSSSWGTNTTSFVYDTDAHGGSRSIRINVRASARATPSGTSIPWC